VPLALDSRLLTVDPLDCTCNATEFCWGPLAATGLPAGDTGFQGLPEEPPADSAGLGAPLGSEWVLPLPSQRVGFQGHVTSPYTTFLPGIRTVSRPWRDMVTGVAIPNEESVAQHVSRPSPARRGCELHRVDSYDPWDGLARRKRNAYIPQDSTSRKRLPAIREEVRA
jgi:hypothetical protein